MLRERWQILVRLSTSVRLLIFWMLLLPLPPLAPARAEAPIFLEEFEGTELDPSWEFRDGYAANRPDDGPNHATMSVAGSHLTLSIPGGVGHNQWLLEHSQLTRPYEGSGVYEIEVDVNFDKDQQFGLVFESSRGTFVMCMLYSDYYVRAYVEQFTLMEDTQHRNPSPGHTTFLRPPQPGPFYIRVTVLDDTTASDRTWSFEWSRDSVAWTTAFSGAVETAEATRNIGEIKRVGVFAGNHGNESTALEARFAYFKTTPISQLPPEAPGNLVATAKVESVALSWDRVASAGGYRLHRSTVPGGPYAEIASGTGTHFLDTGLDNGTTYYYSANSYNDQGDSPDSIEVAATPRAADRARVPPTLAPPAAVPSNGLILLLDAGNAALETLDGESVTLWRDASGRNNDAVASRGRAPTLDAHAIGGRPALRFDGTDDFFSLPSGFADFTDGLSLFVVIRPSVLQPGFKILALGNAAAEQSIALGRNGVEAGLQYFARSADGRWGEIVTSPVLVADETSVFSLLQSGGAENTRASASLHRNGEVVGFGSALVPPRLTRSLNLIGQSYWNEGRFQGSLAEIILYDRRLSPSEAAGVGRYLERKYR